MGFVYRALIMLVRRKAGPHALAGVRIFLSDQAPATLHVHRLLAAMHYRTASAGTLTRGPVVAFCWFHRFIVGWGRQGASVQATCRWASRGRSVLVLPASIRGDPVDVRPRVCASA
jgi:hypothetical protein